MPVVFPDLAPCDFHFFLDLKNTHFTSDEEFKKVVKFLVKKRQGTYFSGSMEKFVICWD